MEEAIWGMEKKMGGGVERAGGGEWNEGREKEKSELRHLICEAFIIVTRVMRHLSVTEICDWLILFYQDPDHLEAFLRAIVPTTERKTIWVEKNILMHSTPVSLSLLHFLPSSPGRENICERFASADQHRTGKLAYLENRFRGYSPTPYTFNATIHSCPKHHTHHCATFFVDNWPAARSSCRERREKEVREGIIGSRLPE